jgi:hypothetical protein
MPSSSTFDDSLATYVVDLAAASVIPRSASGASGKVFLKLAEDQKSLFFHITQNVSASAEVELHVGTAVENGNTVSSLQGVHGDEVGVFELTDAERFTALDNGLMYVTVSASSEQTAEIRGQVLHPGDLVYAARLTVEQQDPVYPTVNRGAAQIVVPSSRSTFRYHVTSSIDSQYSIVINRGIAKTRGVPVQALPTGQIVDGSSPLSEEGYDDLTAGRWYLNVHSALNREGEIRGQLLQPGEVLYVANLSGVNEIPEVSSGITSTLQLVLAPDQQHFRYQFSYVDGDVVGAQIHYGAADAIGPSVYALEFDTGGEIGVEPPVQTVTAEDLAMLRQGNWYVNLASAQSIAGAARGQLLAPAQ